MHVESASQRAGGLRLLRFVTFVNSLGVVAAIGLLVFAFHTIQASREDGIRRACVEQNSRHDRTVQALDLLIARAKRDGGERARRAAQGRASTLLLINALVPHQDCAARATRLTR